MLRKQKTRAWLLSLAALVLLMSNYFVGWAVEPDPRILWVNKELYKIGGFVVHPNGNVIAYGLATIYDKTTGIFEIDGKDGKLIRVLPNTQNISNFEQMDISYDGRYIATPGVNLYDLENNTLEKLEINDGNFVTFLPNQHKIANVSGGTVGNNSSIIIYDIDTKNKVNIKTEEAIRNIAFSPDGKYFATAGVKEDFGGNFITLFKLWDAQSLKMIKELALYNNSNKQIAKIEFSNDSKMVAFKNLDNTQINIFDIQSFKPIKNYTIESYGDYMTGFSWIENNTHIILSKSLTLCKITDEFRKVIYDFTGWGHQIETDFENNRMITRSGPPFLGSMLISWDLKVALSNDTETPLNKELKSEYQNGNLLISGINSSNNSIQLEIFDINGKIIRQLKVEPNGTELRIPIVLAKGTYLLNLTDGNKKYSSKFLVCE